MIQQYNAQYIVQGLTQRLGVDFIKTTLVVVAFTLLRVFLAIVAKQDMEIKQLDINSTFLYSDLNKKIYFEQLEGFWIDGKNNKKFVYRLNKAIYGLNQVEQVWWQLNDLELPTLGFQSNAKDFCIYTQHEDGYLPLLTIYINDLMIVLKSMERINSLEYHL